MYHRYRQVGVLAPQIGSLSVGPEADSSFVQLYVIFMNQLSTVLPITADIPKAYEGGSDDEQEFVQNLAIFLTGFLKVSVLLLQRSMRLAMR